MLVQRFQFDRAKSGELLRWSWQNRSMGWEFEWWKPDMELSIWAYHANEFDVGRRACDRLLADTSLPGISDVAHRLVVHHRYRIHGFDDGFD